MQVRTRFAPSPTGYLHVGGIRTALFAWLVAHQAGGKFILRIEDTDRARLVTGSEQHIQDSLKALGLNWDEGPINQSDRLSLYLDWAKKLIEAGRAYADPYSPEEVQAFREQAQREKRPFLYRNNRPENPPEWNGESALRFKSDPKPYEWHDEVMGDLSSGAESIDDFILLKSGEIPFPTYNFAHIIDDTEMEISHVIRGQEFLASVPNYLNLYEALGINRPLLATLPHILGPDGKKKLSKRDGAKDVLDYVRDGYLPEALVSFIATLGWNDGTEQEVFTEDELIEKFSLGRVQRSGAKFDEQRLLWVNGHFIREMPLDELYGRSESYWGEEAGSAPADYKKRVLGLVQERLKYLSELPGLTSFFFQDLPADMELIENNKNLQKLSQQQMREMFVKSRESLEKSDFSQADLTERLNQLLEETGQKPGVLFSLIRIATTWSPASPGLAETLELIGKDKSLGRLDKALQLLA